MGIIVRRNEYTPAPEGSHRAVCVDVIDLGEITTTWQGESRTRHMVRLVWQIDEVDASGKRHHVRRDYTASLGDKAALRRDLEAWRGRPFTAEELSGFDLETVIGSSCLVQIVHREGSRGGVFANVAAVMRLPKGMKPLEPVPYEREQARKDQEDIPPAAPIFDDDEVPF